jgi:hypothetical protein
VSFHRRLFLSFLFFWCMFFTSQTTDAITNPKSVWQPGVGFVTLAVVIGFMGVLWGGDE